MTNQRSDLIRQLADIVDFEPEKFDMKSFDCGSTACLVGHIVRITDDKYMPADSYFRWHVRQSAKIGLDLFAGDYLFNRAPMMFMSNSEISEVLRNLAKEVDELPNGELIGKDRISGIVSDISTDSLI